MAFPLADAQAQYAKDESLKKDDVIAFMDWTNKQPHLPQINELQAILFLHSCYNRNEPAKATIDIFFTIKTALSDFFKKRNPLNSPLKEVISRTLITALPKKTLEGYTIFLIKLLDTSASHFDYPRIVKFLDLVSMLHLHQEGISNGHVIVVDLEGFTLSHMLRLEPLAVKKFLYYLQNAMPVRLKSFHFVNTVPFMDKILALMRPFMKKELMDMLHLHSTVDDLTQFVPRDCLPQEYGGSEEAISVLHEKIRSKLDQNVAFFNWEDEQSVDESLRPEKSQNADDIFGLEGTFKKLELD